MPSLRVDIRIRGVNECERALDRLMEYMNAAAQDAVEECAQATVDDARRIMGPVHPRGTPGAPAGAPPWRITRRLSMSLNASRAYLTGIDSYSAFAGPTKPPVYGRVQELGRAGGRWPNTHVNPHPYLKPAWEKLLRSGEFSGFFYRHAADAERAALR